MAAPKDEATKVAGDTKKEGGTEVQLQPEVKANVTDREKQIAAADAAMEKKNDDSSEGAKALVKAGEDEEAKYANHADLPPATGKAFNTNTPSGIAEDGSKTWG